MIKDSFNLRRYLRSITLIGLITCSIPLSNIEAQDIEGTWMSKYSLRISKDNFSSQDSLKVHIDSSYTAAFFLMQFLPDNQSLLKLPLYRDHRNLLKGYYTFAGEHATSVFDSLSLPIITKGSELMIKDTLRGSYVVMEKIQPAGQLSKNLISEATKAGSYWKMKIDTRSKFHGVELYFDGKNEIVLRQEFGPRTITSTFVECYIDSLENNLLLAFNPSFSSQKSLFRFFSGSNNSLDGQIYEQSFFKEEVRKYQAKMVRFSIPTPNEHLAIKRALLGTWESKTLELPSRSHSVYKFESIEEQYYTITFTDNERFNIAYGGDLINEGVARPDNKTYAGTWTLGKAGNYLALQYDDGTESLLSLIDLDELSISFCLDTKALGFQSGTSTDYYFRLHKR